MVATGVNTQGRNNFNRWLHPMEDSIAFRSPTIARLALITIVYILIFHSSAGAQGLITVEWKDCRLTVNADQASLSQILSQVADKTGIRVKGVEELQERGSIAFSKVPLRQGLESLLSGFNYAITSEPSCAEGVSPAMVTVFGPGPGLAHDFTSMLMRPVATTSKRAEGREAAGDKKRAKKSTTPDAEEQRLRNDLLDSDPNVKSEALDKLTKRLGSEALDTLLSVAESDDPTLRQHSLELLSQSTQTDPATLVPAFSQALQDEDPNVQELAVRTLATQGGSDGLETLRQAFGGADPSMKAMILESLGSTPEAVPLLQQASSDSDDSVRASATALLQEASSREEPDDAVSSPVDVITKARPPGEK